MMKTCGNCVRFGYWKETHSGRQMVRSDARNFNYYSYSYLDIAIRCRDFKPKQENKKGEKNV